MRSRLSKILLFSSGVCVLSFPLLYGHMLIKDNPAPGLLPVESLQYQADKPYDNFRAENISLVKKKNNRPFFSLTAEEIIHRKRLSRLFLYQNLKEVYVSGAKIDICLDTISSAGNGLLIDEMHDVFTSLGKSPTSLDEYSSGKVRDSDLDLLSRIYFENLSLNIFYPGGKRLSFNALYASVTPDFNNLVFSGTVSVTDTMRRKFVAPKVVWSTQYNGIYFPEGYILDKSQHRNESFYVVKGDGDFSRLWDIPAINYADYLEVAENKLYAKIMKKMPAYAKMMLGLPLR